jgi:hypothetical protein
LILLARLPCQAADPAPSLEEIRFFETRVRPVLADNCFKCHGPAKHRGGLRLDSRAAILTGGGRGPAIVPGQPDESLLIKAIGQEDELKMPPPQKLPKEQIADLTRWVGMGAPWPAADQAAAAPAPRRGSFQITDKDRAHWAFQPVRRPLPPEVKNPAWVANPIDAFVLARLEGNGLRPNAPASRRELIRRVHYDLTGLPPSPEEVEAFAADPSPCAYEQLVERLLASPHYGENWGRHWLDLVRFAETNSYERDNPKPHAWRYRDYVIRAFNEDKRYDRFILEQLAGDELPLPESGVANRPADPIIATGYYRLGIWDDEPTDREQARYDGLDDIVATTGQVFLGLTFDCARCHDHKIDPIPQKDYYRLLSFFHNIVPYRNGGPTDEVRLVIDAGGRAWFAPVAADAKQVGGSKRKQPVAADAILCVSEAGNTAPETFVLLRGNPQARGDKVDPGFPQVFGGGTIVVPPAAPGARTTGRRLVLAQWIVSEENPLTARVMMNRIWQYHFGRGLVRSPNNFGTQGDRPTHPELLDWLASEFAARGWRMKPLHRLILNSNAYRMSSRGNPEALAADPVNDLFWRFDMRRLNAEEIRDTLLALSGKLNQKMYGPGVYPEIPAEVLAGQSRPGDGWGKSPPEEQRRRSVYIHVKRSLLTPILESFDAADTDRSNPVRFSTTQPTQALGMLNSAFLKSQATALADRIRQEAGADVAKQVQRALRLVTTRPPSAQEVRRGVELIEVLHKKDGVAADAAVTYFCLLLLNLNELIYLD